VGSEQWAESRRQNAEGRKQMRGLFDSGMMVFQSGGTARREQQAFSAFCFLPSAYYLLLSR